jgi:phosphorylcholine metabolism protein LicD
MDKNAATENLKDAYEVANKIGLFTWLSCGTCLGYYRENDFISHDSDIDLGANITDLTEEKQKQLIEGMENKCFQIFHIFGNRKDGLEISFIRNGIKTEWFFNYEGENCVWNAVWDSRILYYCYSKDIFNSFKEVEFKGIMVNVVEQTEKYLEEQYGDWKSRVVNWHWGKHPKCLRNRPVL